MIFIIIDGIGDVGTPQTQFKTPLQIAKIPNMNMIASSGLCGMMDPVEPGLACGSDTAHMSIFGYDPFKYYRGRGAFETMGSGIEMNVGDIAFKCNFAHIDNGIVKLRRVDREFPQWGLPLIDALKLLPFNIEAKHATEHRIGLKVVGQNLSDQITGTDPLKDNLPLRVCKAKVPEAQKTADLVNNLSEQIHKLLSDHPINVDRQQKGLPTANIILMRGCGQRINVPSFKEKYGLNGAIIAPTAIIQGLGKTIGLDYIKVEGATGDYNTNLINKAKAAVKCLQDNYNFVFLHVKAVDDAGHDKSLEKKIKYLELADEMIDYLIKNCDQNVKIAITGDHTTPWAHGDHTYQPVPFAVATIKDLKPGQIGFNEIDCMEGKLGRFCGRSVMRILN
ncbi:hypothetical protein pb186bvf_001965 [Paramecium bursaria]